MSLDDNKAVLSRLFDEVANAKNLDVLDEIISDDSVDHGSFPGMPDSGPEAYRAVYAASHAGFSDFHMRVHDMIAEGDNVAVRATVSGTHDGDFVGIPPTGNTISIEAVEIFEVKDGRITGRWGMPDRATLMEQLGLAPQM